MTPMFHEAFEDVVSARAARGGAKARNEHLSRQHLQDVVAVGDVDEIHAELMWLVAVWNDNPCTRPMIPQSSRQSPPSRCLFWGGSSGRQGASSVPLRRKEHGAILFPVRLGRSFPPQWTLMGMSGANEPCIMAEIPCRHVHPGSCYRCP